MTKIVYIAIPESVRGQESDKYGGFFTLRSKVKGPLAHRSFHILKLYAETVRG